MRKAAGALALAAVSAAAAAALRRRPPKEHVDVYFADGSMVSLADDAEAPRLMSLAREVLSAAAS